MSAARRQVCDEALIAEAIQKTDSDPFFTIGIFLHPSTVMKADSCSDNLKSCQLANRPAPINKNVLGIQDAEGNDTSIQQLDEIDGIQALCFNGSAVLHKIPELSRAAWAIVGMGEDTRVPLFTMTRPVWGSLPQTSQAAENVAAAQLVWVV